MVFRAPNENLETYRKLHHTKGGVWSRRRRRKGGGKEEEEREGEGYGVLR
jgi:hypothetical protein